MDEDENGAQMEGSMNEGMGSQMEDAMESQQESENLIVDPEDPLYGLEQRLKHTNLDDMTKSIIRSKLQEAQGKIKHNLDAR